MSRKLQVLIIPSSHWIATCKMMRAVLSTSVKIGRNGLGTLRGSHLVVAMPATRGLAANAPSAPVASSKNKAPAAPPAPAKSDIVSVLEKEIAHEKEDTETVKELESLKQTMKVLCVSRAPFQSYLSVRPA
jgi:hypothetical protein